MLHPIFRQPTTSSTQENSVRSIVDDIIAYEQGELSALQTLELFGLLIRSGQAWTLQGAYGRAATAFLDQGLIDGDGSITDHAYDLLADLPEED